MTHQNDSKQHLGEGIQYSGARPMKVHTDASGHQWLCDAHVDPNQSFESQGCWRMDQMPFDRNY